MAGDAATVNSPGLGKFLLPLDLGSGGTIYPAVLGSNRKQYTTGRIEDLAKIDSTFSCAMENPTIDRTLTSTTTTAVVECPLNSQALVNFGSASPTPRPDPNFMKNLIVAIGLLALGLSAGAADYHAVSLGPPTR
jgi:hypothetical protein